MTDLPAPSTTSSALSRRSSAGSTLTHRTLKTALSALARSDPRPELVSEEDRAAIIDVARRGAGCGPKEAAHLAKRLMGCYRSRDFVDPEVFAVALTATFAQHPAEIGALVVDPLHGLPRRMRYAPSIAEVADELQRLQGMLEGVAARLNGRV